MKNYYANERNRILNGMKCCLNRLLLLYLILYSCLNCIHINNFVVQTLQLLLIKCVIDGDIIFKR